MTDEKKFHYFEADNEMEKHKMIIKIKSHHLQSLWPFLEVFDEMNLSKKFTTHEIYLKVK